ncbi:MAG: L,D-transpeptidase family protein [Alphaproteobacteria bacterium]
MSRMKSLLPAKKPTPLPLQSILFVFMLMLFATPAFAGDAKLRGDVLGEVSHYTVKKNDSLYSIARKFDLSVTEVQAANPGVDIWKPKPGTELKIAAAHLLPTASRDGIVINLAKSRLYYFTKEGDVMSFPIASGKSGWETPQAATVVTLKRKNPIWTPPPRIREENPDLPDFIPAGPDNPLGGYAISLGISGIMIHGTTSPNSIGKQASHGCIRMYSEHVEKLFEKVQKGTPVLIMKSNYELGWNGDRLFMEVAPKVKSIPKKTKAAALKPVKAKLNTALYQAIMKQAPDAAIDWEEVEAALQRADGIPVPVGVRLAGIKRDAMLKAGGDGLKQALFVTDYRQPHY